MSCSGDKAGEVPQENIFIYSSNILHVSKQSSYSCSQVLIAAGYRVNGTETNNLC